MKAGIFGLHLTLNPQELPVEARMSQAARARGVRLTDKEFAALAKSRQLGKTSIRRILDAAASDFSPSTREKLSLTITDALLETSFEKMLAREHPNWQDRAKRLDAVLSQASGASSGLTPPPVGFTLTIHWGKPPGPGEGPYHPLKHGP